MVLTEADKLYKEYQKQTRARRERAADRMSSRGDVHGCRYSEERHEDTIEELQEQMYAHQFDDEPIVESTLRSHPEELVQPSAQEATRAEMKDHGATEAEPEEERPNQWKLKHIEEDHDAFWRREWAEHVRHIGEAAPLRGE